MTNRKALAENPYMRLDEGKAVSTTLRRGTQLCKKMLMAAVVAACAACGAYDWDYRVQYVRIPKGGYFNSDVAPQVNTKVTMSVALNSGSEMDVFGTPSRKSGCFILNSDNSGNTSLRPSLYYRYGQSSSNGKKHLLTVGFRHEIEASSTLIVDGETVQTVRNGLNSSFTETISFPGQQYPGSESVFYFKVEDNNAVACELIPCVKDGTPCFYDTVSETYKTMSGTGTPVAGPQVNDDGTHLAVGNTILEPDGEGWYTFGDTSYSDAYGKSPTMVYPRWTNLHLSASAKIRLRGGVVLDPVPSTAMVDMSAAKAVFAHYRDTFPGAFTIPSDVIFRYGPGTIGGTDGALTYSDDYSSAAITNDVENNGTFWTSNGSRATPTFSGKITGTGKFRTYDFSKGFYFSGNEPFAFNGTIEHGNGANGAFTQISKSNIMGEIARFTTESVGAGSTYRTNGTLCQIRLQFMPSAGTISMPLRIKDYCPDGGGGFLRSIFEGGRWYRYGHAICIKDDNRVVVGSATGGFQVIDDDGLINTTRQWSGTPTIEFGSLGLSGTAAHMYATTNLNIIVTNMLNASTKIDFNGYTNIATSVNRSWMRVYGTCDSSASVYARNPAFLPHELTGFSGRIRLSEDATEWNFPVDFDAHTPAEYLTDPNLANLDGCKGSGTLYTMPASGTVNVSVTCTGDDPPRGLYPLMTCTDGADFSGWTVNVTVNGTVHANVADGEVDMRGRRVLKVLRETTGLWLKVGIPGIKIVFR